MNNLKLFQNIIQSWIERFRVNRYFVFVKKIVGDDTLLIKFQEALVSNVPESVLSKFQEAIDKANNGLLNWLFKHRGMKLLSVLTLPYTLPADVVYATFTKYVLW